MLNQQLERGEAIYILPQAKVNRQAFDDVLFGMRAKVQESLRTFQKKWVKRRKRRVIETDLSQDERTALLELLAQVRRKEDLVVALRNGGGGVNAGPAGVEVKVDVANELVRAREINSIFKLPPKESHAVLIASKHATVFVFAMIGEMRLVYHNLVLKKGCNLVVAQSSVDNSMVKGELKQIKLFLHHYLIHPHQDAHITHSLDS
ncbi:hypothetical protein BGZ58_001601 [Dissophora ornata]|nr:hypothetical protein BGZ58_001601 [Dissophora ornata]